MAPSTSPWEGLPSEVLEIVFTFLPFHILCRTRLVCKKWDRLITHPSFCSLRTHSSHRPSYILLTPKIAHNQGRPERPLPCQTFDRWDLHKWEILDKAENRFYTLSDYFITDNFVGLGLGLPKCSGWRRYTAAIDGGLIYAMYSTGGGAEFERHIVCDPVRQCYQVVPFPHWGAPRFKEHYDDVIAMAVEPERFQIVLMDAPNMNPSGGEQNIQVYDSKTKQWRLLANSPFFDHGPLSCVFLEGVFYVLFVDTSMVPRCPKLYSCDLDTDVWSHVDVELPRPLCLVDQAQLVVSSKRLFLVEYTGLQTFGGFFMSSVEAAKLRRHHVIKVKIWEVVLAKKEVVKVAEMPKYARYSEKVMRLSKTRPRWLVGNPVVALGAADSIVISSWVSRSVAWDLVRHCWEDLPTLIKFDKPVPFVFDEGICAGLLSF